MNQTRKEGSTGKNSKNQKKKFIMLPTVDYCFKELMQNEKVRKGLIAAVMRVDPKEIESTYYMTRMYTDQISSGEEYDAL